VRTGASGVEETLALFQDGWTKYVLRRAMESHLPKEIVWRREKMGFPFDYQGFLSANRPGFEPALRRIDVLGTSPDRFGSYDALMASDPMKLWRLCSTALWLGREEAVTATSAEAAA